MIIGMTIYYVPLLLFAVILTIVFEDYIVQAFCFGTVFAKFYILQIHPKISLLLHKTKVEWPEEHLGLRQQIIDLATNLGYKDAENKIVLTRSTSGDLHSNASVNSHYITLSAELLDHHAGHPEEVIAIVGHELGHWTDSDLTLFSFFDVVYMTICGIFFQACINNPYLLSAFGFTQQSVFMSIYLFYRLYSVTGDYPLRKLFNVLYRYCEYKADLFSARTLSSRDIQLSLLRNYSVNLDALFIDPMYAKLEMSHPTLLERIEALESYEPRAIGKDEAV
jgi:STE24 endopeptidase